MTALVVTAAVCVVGLIVLAALVFDWAYDSGYEHGFHQGYADGKLGYGVRPLIQK